MSGHLSDEEAEETVASSTTVGATKRRNVCSSQTAEKKTGMFVSCVCVHAYVTCGL